MSDKKSPKINETPIAIEYREALLGVMKDFRRLEKSALNLDAKIGTLLELNDRAKKLLVKGALLGTSELDKNAAEVLADVINDSAKHVNEANDRLTKAQEIVADLQQAVENKSFRPK